jgi:hypothetical protein
MLMKKKSFTPENRVQNKGCYHSTPSTYNTTVPCGVSYLRVSADGISVSEKKFPPSNNFEIKSSMNKMSSQLKFLHD